MLKIKLASIFTLILVLTGSEVYAYGLKLRYSVSNMFAQVENESSELVQTTNSYIGLVFPENRLASDGLAIGQAFLEYSNDVSFKDFTVEDTGLFSEEWLTNSERQSGCVDENSVYDYYSCPDILTDIDVHNIISFGYGVYFSMNYFFIFGAGLSLQYIDATYSLKADYDSSAAGAEILETTRIQSFDLKFIVIGALLMIIGDDYKSQNKPYWSFTLFKLQSTYPLIPLEISFEDRGSFKIDYFHSFVEVFLFEYHFL